MVLRHTATRSNNDVGAIIARISYFPEKVHDSVTGGQPPTHIHVFGYILIMYCGSGSSFEIDSESVQKTMLDESRSLKSSSFVT